MGKKLTREQFIEKARKVHCNRNNIKLEERLDLIFNK